MGGNQASSVAEEAWEIFFERLELAESELNRASELNPDDPTPYSRLLTIARGLNWSQDDTHSLWEEAVALDAQNLAAHSQYLSYLCEKWHGSHELMFQFARQHGVGAPEASHLHELIADAHIERWLYSCAFDEDPNADEYWHDNEVHSEILTAYRRSLGSRYFEESPPDNYIPEYLLLLFVDGGRN